MISLLMTPLKDTDTFQKHCETIKDTIGEEYEIVCTIFKADPMAEWFKSYTFDNGIRAMMVPELGVPNIINLLAARARGDYIFYVPDILEFEGRDDGWGKRAVGTVGRRDNICGGILSATINDQYAMGLFMPLKTFHVLGYYCCPIFETPIYGYRWNASILTELDRLVNVPCGMNYKRVLAPDLLQQDADIFSVTRPVRLRMAELAKGFMEKAYDTDTPDNR